MIFSLTLNSFLFTLPPSNDKDFVYSSWSLDFILGQKVARLNQRVVEKPRQNHLDIWGNQVLSSPCPRPLCDEENGTPSFWLEAIELLPAIHFCLYLRRRLARGKDGKSPILDNIGNHSVKLLNPTKECRELCLPSYIWFLQVGQMFFLSSHFQIFPGYPDFTKAMLARGWFQNEDKDSPWPFF